MGFLGLGTPKWRHKDLSVRQAAIARLGVEDEGILVKVALEDGDAGLRAAAAAKVASEGALRRLLGSSDAKVVAIAKERLAGVAQTRVAEGTLDRVRDLLTTIDEHSALGELSLTAKDPAVREAAFVRLLAMTEPSANALATIAIQDADGKLAPRAVQALTRRQLLKDVAKKAKRPEIREAAATKVSAIDAEADKPSPEQLRKQRAQRLDPLAARASRAAVTADTTKAEPDVAAIEQELAAVLADFPGVADDEAVTTVRSRIARARAAIAEKRLAQAEAAHSAAEAVAVRERFLAAEATGSSDPEARAALVARWAALPAPTPSAQAGLDERFARLLADRFAVDGDAPVRAAFRELSADEAAELAQLAQQAEAQVELAASPDWRDAEFRFQGLHKRWMQLTLDLDPNHPDRLRLLAAWNAFKDRRKAVRAERASQREAKLGELEQLVAAAEGFAKNPAPAGDEKKRYEELKRLRAAWRSIGFAPGADRLRTRFEAALDGAFAPLQALREAEDWERFANVAKAEALTAEVQALAASEDLAQIARAVQAAHKRWKDVGALPRDRQQALWEAFKAACDTQYDRCKAFFAERDAQRQASLEKKTALLAEAEQIAKQGTIGIAGSVADRQAKERSAQRLKELQSEWKAAGPAPRADDERLWQAFRAACDGFFQTFNVLRDQEQRENLTRKEGLIAQVERIVETARSLPGAVRGDKDRWLRQVRDLQAEWKQVGFVPREQQQVLWARFKVACDAIYDLQRDAQPEESAEDLSANLAAKQDLVARLEALAAQPGDDARRDAGMLLLRWRSVGALPPGQGEDLPARWKAAWAAAMGEAKVG